MTNNNNKITGKKSRNTSQSGGTLTQRLAFDDDYQSFRQHDVNTPVHDRFHAEYDIDGNIEKITYYFATEREVLEVETVADVNSSLNNTYFEIYSAYDRIGFYIWFNVNGAGTDPALTGLTGIEIPIMENDSAKIVAMAIKMYTSLNTEFSYLCSVSHDNTNKLTFDRNQLGTVDNDSAGTSGFSLNVKTEGTERIEAIHSLIYNSDCEIIDIFKL